ncbi:MAG: hypothetical protein HAW67_00710 [Endozoicomonadaceae bacterium]|nr:hypothetical protein [Endozoicomonadaceae bacterium]
MANRLGYEEQQIREALKNKIPEKLIQLSLECVAMTEKRRKRSLGQ